MTKIRTFFGLGRKSKKISVDISEIKFQDNFIMGSTHQKVSREDSSKSILSDKQQKK